MTLLQSLASRRRGSLRDNCKVPPNSCKLSPRGSRASSEVIRFSERRFGMKDEAETPRWNRRRSGKCNVTSHELSTVHVQTYNYKKMIFFFNCDFNSSHNTIFLAESSIENKKNNDFSCNSSTIFHLNCL